MPLLFGRRRSLQLHIRGLPRRIRDWGLYKAVDERVVNMSTVLPLVRGPYLTVQYFRFRCLPVGCGLETLHPMALVHGDPGVCCTIVLLLSEAVRRAASLVRSQIHELHSPAMRDRHWKDLLDVTEQHRPPAERRMSRVRLTSNDLSIFVFPRDAFRFRHRRVSVVCKYHLYVSSM